ncbi:hypothetical protein AAGS61_04895 [Lysinibacillus sp. KU-BSD001]|uniref:hypothetical protein n=1 Tax=Lysinibacillus sp. KU-BSD001 TaxID=3141328 RepID=UPI0036E9CCB9
MKKLSILLTVFTLLLLPIQSVMAKPNSDDVVSDFMMALVKKDEKRAMSYVAADTKIPEIREVTSIKRFSGLPSPTEQMRVVIAYFDDGENIAERIAFIWEVTTNQEKITDIRVVYDGANPFMNEGAIIKEYEAKHKTKILKASEFPFTITHVEGNIEKDMLVLTYQNADTNQSFQVKIVPNAEEALEGEGNQLYTLENGRQVLYHSNAAIPQLVFQHHDFTYSVSVHATVKQTITVEDLLLIANSMF